ncbi:MAG: hypothetical protein ACSLEN_01675 [Candidatus Malihini olakiniferum]
MCTCVITSGRTLAILHVRAKEAAEVRQVVWQVERELYACFSVEHATVAIDWGDEDEAACTCSRAYL